MSSLPCIKASAQPMKQCSGAAWVSQENHDRQTPDRDRKPIATNPPSVLSCSQGRCATVSTGQSPGPPNKQGIRLTPLFNHQGIDLDPHGVTVSILRGTIVP